MADRRHISVASNCWTQCGVAYRGVLYVCKSISKLQIQVVTHVFELSAGNCHRWMAALSSFIVTCNDRYAHDCKDGVAVTRWRHP